jgi:hypothetical protein
MAYSENFIVDLELFCSEHDLTFKSLLKPPSKDLEITTENLVLYLPVSLDFISSDGRLTSEGRKYLRGQLDV